MRCAIVSVGTELLFGQTVNTNTVYLSRQLNLMGFDVLYHHSVGDNPGRLTHLLQSTLGEVDMILTTGGLGPTEDDLTKEMVAETMGVDLVEDPNTLEALRKGAERKGRKLTENNYKQAMLPRGAEIFDNPVGTAPGFALRQGDKIVLSMPGPPRELIWMWNHRAKPYLLRFVDGTIDFRLIREFGIGESAVETLLLPFIDGQTDPTIATYAKEGEVSIRVASKRSRAEEARRAVDDMTARLGQVLGASVYSYDGEDLPVALGRALIQKRLTLSACESCTGGMFSEQMISCPGVSAVFDRGLVTYSEKAKREELGVSLEILNRYKAESPETARAMAEGLAKKTGSDVCISSTGVAGPGSWHGVEAGTCFVGLTYRGKTSVRTIRTQRAEREWNRRYFCLSMMDFIRRTVGIQAELIPKALTK